MIKVLVLVDPFTTKVSTVEGVLNFAPVLLWDITSLAFGKLPFEKVGAENGKEKIAQKIDNKHICYWNSCIK